MYDRDMPTKHDLAAQAARRLAATVLQGGPSATAETNALMEEMRCCYPRHRYYVIPLVGFVVQVPYAEVGRVPLGIAQPAHRIEAIDGFPYVQGAPRGRVYVHKNRSGATGWLTPHELSESAAQEALRTRAEVQKVAAALTQLPNMAPLQDLMWTTIGNLPTKPAPTVWERLGRDDFGE